MKNPQPPMWRMGVTVPEPHGSGGKVQAGRTPQFIAAFLHLGECGTLLIMSPPEKPQRSNRDAPSENRTQKEKKLVQRENDSIPALSAEYLRSTDKLLLTKPLILEDTCDQIPETALPLILVVTAKRDGYARVTDGEHVGWVEMQRLRKSTAEYSEATTHSDGTLAIRFESWKTGNMEYRVSLQPDTSGLRITNISPMANGKPVNIDGMPKEDVETLFMKMATDPSGVGCEACLMSAYAIRQCPRCLEILVTAAKNSPGSAFRHYDSYKNLPFKSTILHSASEAIHDRIKVSLLIQQNAALASLPKEEILSLLRSAEGVYSSERERIGAAARDGNVPADMPEHFGLSEDVTLGMIGRIRDEWLSLEGLNLKGPDSNEQLTSQLKVLIARNLFWNNKDVAAENVQAEIRNLVAARAVYGPLPLFKGRNVVFVTHNEKTEGTLLSPMLRWMSGNRYNTGKTKTQEAIRRQQGAQASYSFIRSPDKAKEIEVVKKQILEKLSTTPPPLTILLMGHGSPDGVYLHAAGSDDAHGDPSRAITPDDLATVLKERARKFPTSQTQDSQRDIIILLSCFNANFIRNVRAKLGLTLPPIMVGSAGFNQYGVVTPGSEYESNFIRRTLNLSGVEEWQHEDGITTFDDIFQNEFKTETNPGIFIPGDEQFLQIMRNDPKGTGSEEVIG